MFIYRYLFTLSGARKITFSFWGFVLRTSCALYLPVMISYHPSPISINGPEVIYSLFSLSLFYQSVQLSLRQKCLRRMDANQLMLLAQILVSGLLLLIGKDMVNAAFLVALSSTHHYCLIYPLLHSFLVLSSKIWSHNLNWLVLSLPLVGVFAC